MRQLAERIETWRQERDRLEPMPAELWREAVEFASKLGCYPTARGLRIDYGSLKKKLEAELGDRMTDIVDERAGAMSSVVAGDDPFRFVELDMARLAEPPVVGETTIEMVRHDGATMTVRLPSMTAFDLGGLVESFWRLGP
jgi:hypothetical protein